MPPFPKEQYNGAIRTGLAAMVGAANLYLFHSQQNYFTADQNFNPFLHTWSLGIEEQFYVLFSLSFFLVVPFLLAAFRSNHEAAKLKWTRISLISALTLASATLLASASRRDEVGTYYLLQFRFWELGIGSLLAICCISDELSTQFQTSYLVLVRQLGSMLALTIIAYVAIMPASTSPDLAIAIATLSCGVLIWLNFAPHPSSNVLIAKALAWPPITSVGRVSYSLYLWHWPVFAVFATTVGLKSFGAMASAIGLIVTLSVTSYFLVEKPLRKTQTPFWHRTVPMLCLTAVVILSLTAAAQFRPGFAFLGVSQAWMSDWLPDSGFSYVGSNRITTTDCDLSNGAAVPVDIPTYCAAKIARPPLASPTILSVGDSLSYADWGMLSYGFTKGIFNLSALSHDGCNIYGTDEEISQSCRSYWETMPKRIQDTVGRGDFIFIAWLWNLEKGVDQQRVFSKLKNLIDVAKHVGATVIIQAPLPQFGRDAFLCTVEWFRTDYEGCSIGRREFVDRRSILMKQLNLLRSEDQIDVLIWDPIDQLCDIDYCRQFVGSKPLFRNWDHLSYWGSRSLGQAFVHFFRDASHTL